MNKNDDERERAREEELRELRHAITHPRVRFERDSHGRLSAMTPTGIFPQQGMFKKIIRRDARERLAEILFVPIGDVAEQIAEIAKDGVRGLPAPVVTVGAETFAHLPRSTDVEAIRRRAEQLLTERTGKTVVVRIQGPCERAAEGLYGHVHESIARLEAGAHATITVGADTLPRELDALKVTHALAAMIGERHADKVGQVQIVLNPTSAQGAKPSPPAPPAKRPAGFRP
jgi:hypothetical protein